MYNFPNSNISNKIKIVRCPLRIAMFLYGADATQVKRLIIASSLGLTDNPIIPQELAVKYREYTWEQLWTKDEEDWYIQHWKDIKSKQ